VVSASRFKGKSFISMRDYNRDEIDFILGVADEMMPLEAKGTEMAKGKVMGVLFFEPSTRTRLSFESAMHRLDIIAMRHPDEWSSRRAAAVASIPILNGGSGPWEHPTQAVLDMHCIKHA